MLSFSVVKSAGSAGNYYTDKDNYYVLGSMGERWAGQPEPLSAGYVPTGDGDGAVEPGDTQS